MSVIVNDCILCVCQSSSAWWQRNDQSVVHTIWIWSDLFTTFLALSVHEQRNAAGKRSKLYCTVNVPHVHASAFVDDSTTALYTASRKKTRQLWQAVVSTSTDEFWQTAPAHYQTRGQSNLTKSASRGPIPRLGVIPGGRKLYHWIPGVGFPISVP